LVTLNIFQDLATPHNNVLIKALKARPDIVVKTWYAYETLPGYPQTICYAHELGRSEIFGGQRPNPKVLRYWLTHPDEKYLLVGWANPTLGLLVLLSWALGRDFSYWTDHPKDKNRGRLKEAVHRVFLRILAERARPFFGVGQPTIEYFDGRGIPRENMVTCRSSSRCRGTWRPCARGPWQPGRSTAFGPARSSWWQAAACFGKRAMMS